MDSLFLVLQNQENEIEKVSVLTKIGDVLVDRDKDSADLYYNQGLQIANRLLSEQNPQKKQILKYKSDVLSGLGYVSYLNANYKVSISLLEESLGIKNSLSKGKFKEKKIFYKHLSLCYYQLGNYQTSIEYLLDALHKNKFDKDSILDAEIYYALGKNYFKIESYQKSNDYYIKSISISKKNDVNELLGLALNGLAENYIKTKKWKKASESLFKAKKVLEANNSPSIIENFALLARIKIEKKQLDSAQFYLEKGEELALEFNNQFDLVKIYNIHALLNIEREDYTTAIMQAHKMLKLGQAKKDITVKIDAYKLLYELYAKKYNYESAYLYLKRYNAFKDSLAVDDAQNMLFKEEVKMETHQRILKDSLKFETYNVIKNNQIEANRIELEQVKRTKIFLFGGLFVLLIALIGFVRSFIRKKKDNEIILQQKLAVEKQQQKLADQNDELQSKAKLYKILQACSSDNNLHGILKVVLEQLLKTDLIGKEEKGFISLAQEKQANWAVECSHNLSKSELEEIQSLPYDNCICGVKYVNSIVEYCKSDNGLNHFNVPIINNSEVQGVIILYSSLPIDKMKEAEEFLNSIGILLGETIYRHKISDKLRMAHIENTIKKKEIERAHVKVNHSLQKQEAINDLMGAIIRNENIGEKVYNYTSEIFDGIFIRRLNITLFNFENETVKFYFLRENGVEKLKKEAFPLSNFSTETIDLLKRNQRVTVQSIKAKEIKSETDKQMMRNNIDSFASFPLMIDSVLLGAFNISFEEEIKFTVEQEEFISMLIEGITIAINQNLLFTEIYSMNDKLTSLNAEIKSSINYALKLQQSVLPSQSERDEIFNKKFVLLKQKDVVGGDFYWMREYENGIKMIAAIDCTGHGIPGAFMTMLSRVLLREAATMKNLRCPSKILAQIDTAVRTIFKQHNYDSMQDGMDMSICVIDENKNKISFSAAQRPIVLKLKDQNTLIIEKGSKFPVGGYFENDKEFKLLTYNLDEVEQFYMFSDGYVDQFGGTNVKKYGTKQFVKTLNLIATMPMHLQKDFLMNELDNWKGELDQIDDILVLGVKLN